MAPRGSSLLPLRTRELPLFRRPRPVRMTTSPAAPPSSRMARRTSTGEGWPCWRWAGPWAVSLGARSREIRLPLELFDRCVCMIDRVLVVIHFHKFKLDTRTHARTYSTRMCSTTAVLLYQVVYKTHRVNCHQHEGQDLAAVA